MTILDALADEQLLGGSFRDPASWARWWVALKAMFGLPMTAEEAAIFAEHTGRQVPPTQPARESWLVVGRRGGKSRVAAAVAVYLSALRTYQLAPGETGVLMVLAADKRQATVVLGYIRALITETPMLARLVVAETAETITLATRVRVEVRAGDYRRVRGVTLLGAVLDEVAFLRSEESASPDVELYRALLPALATTNGMIVGVSSPYSRRGLLWEKYRRHYGKDDPGVLVWRGTSLQMNPTLPPAHVEADLAEDPEAARAEWLAEFRSDLESYVSPEALDAVTVPGRVELPAVPGVEHVGFLDAAGGSGSDSFTAAVAHAEERSDGTTVAVLDAVYEARPPFDPFAVAVEAAEIVRRYGIERVLADRFAGEWVCRAFEPHGVEVAQEAEPKSVLYASALPLVNGRRCELLDVPRLRAQLLGLERSAGRTGRDSIDHGPGGHDDLANAAAGALVAAVAEPSGDGHGMRRWVADLYAKEVAAGRARPLGS